MSRRLAATTAALALIGALAACSSDTQTSAAVTVNVQSGDTACDLSATTAVAGDVVFEVQNTGSKTTEFYLYEADGTTVVGEVENIGPGLTRDLITDLAAGSYVTACKPGMAGEGIRGDFTVTQ